MHIHLFRTACWVMGVVTAFLVTMPLMLYVVGLAAINGRPQAPKQYLSAVDERLVWQKALGAGLPEIPQANPYSLAASFFGRHKHDPGIWVAWQVASTFNTEHLEYSGNAWWHLSGAALSIWLTRHWTTQELLAEAAKNLQAKRKQPEPVATSNFLPAVLPDRQVSR